MTEEEVSDLVEVCDPASGEATDVMSPADEEPQEAVPQQPRLHRQLGPHLDSFFASGW